MENTFDCIVIGGGQAGLASAYYLTKNGLKYIILEASDQATGSWPKYYESLTLFSPAKYSSLPGLQFPGDPNHYPTKDEVISYFNEYTKYHKLNVRTGEKVTKVSKNGKDFVIVTEKGSVFNSKAIIAGTGAFSYPNIPAIDGSEDFKGKIIHSSAYKNVEEFNNQRVIVVGGGNSAIQIAYELAKVSIVSLAIRKPISYIPQRVLGKDIHFWLKVTGIDTLPYGRRFSMNTSVMDTGIYKTAILNNRPDSRLMFANYTEEGVVWVDGREEKVDSVIYATGYKPNVSYLTPLKDAINQSAYPVQTKGISTTVDGLYYVGLSGQRSLSSATIRGVGSDAKYVVKHLIKYIKV
ncbi:putative flavoprotein involved in K+ transport [Bacillus niacini]|uniref:Flavoprotein involved in K+ transport n=1 Tax=Neobacillus niacini TaxID=86668 RepID=A0A852TEY7_9BACI|nr:NAD(P)-binding domain-containing protein [Neobacillus niacini]NYE06217.1 putative flavoprotein involved in K+ transport [Neobacillus niacini]